MIKKTKYKYVLGISVSLVLFIWFLYILPNPLFNKPYSTIINDKNGNLLSARIAQDGQWRFPLSDSVPQKFIDCITTFEDQYFYKHPGVNPLAIARAIKQNIEVGEVVSGGSTISMQCMRMARNNRSRSVWQKLIEMLWTLRFEMAFSKDEILNIYASQAPFGGNVVGLEAASWRYYGRDPWLLSWGEMATLAVLPNAPSLIYPGKNQEQLISKRNRLLDKLMDLGMINQGTASLAKSEPLPQKVYSLKNLTPHLTDFLISEGEEGENIKTTINQNLQNQTQRVVDEFYAVYEQNEINNMAAMIVDVRTSEVLAYVGNTNSKKRFASKDVDIIQAPRSTGSLLKPFLYTMMMQDGLITPFTLIKDIPTQISGYTPKNFEKSYDGMVHANKALSRSLNIPAVKMLQDYGMEKFYEQFSKLEQRYVNRGAHHYGLSIILGGAESCLWDLSNAYLNLAQVLNEEENPLKLKVKKGEEPQQQQKVFEAGAAWWTAQTLTQLERPHAESGWKDYASSRKIAWKTGTSFGHRDAWAIGFTPEYIVAVWVGNATGEGRPGLTGLNYAAPVMFQLFQKFPQTSWFTQPDWDLSPLKICEKSGYLASDLCDETKEVMLHRNARNTSPCPFHKEIQLDQTKKYRVNSSCYSVYDMETDVYFVLPPVPEWYFKRVNPFYKPLPPFLEDCKPSQEELMAIVYPKDYTKILIPRLLDGEKGKVVFEIVHQQQETVFWHLDDEYLGETSSNHRMEIRTQTGRHKMTLVDSKGRELFWWFEVVE